MTPLVDVENLKVVFHGDRGRITHAVESVSFDLAPGVTLGLVGESGCGKSVTALAIMGLLPKGSAQVSGRVDFDGNNLLDLTDAAMQDTPPAFEQILVGGALNERMLETVFRIR